MQVRSADGTTIGFERLGAGPALVIVHGSIATATDGMRVAELLQDRFTCFLMDRRGRGQSPDDGTPYSIEREYEDIVAVLGEAGPGANLFGHSFGGICALGAALRVPVPRLILYEPPLTAGGRVDSGNLDTYRSHVNAGRLDDALEVGLLRFVRLPRRQVRAMRAMPAWSQLAALTPTWVRETEALDSLGSDLRRYRAVTCPTLLLAGTESSEHPLKDATRELSAIIPDVRIATLEGQGHGAMRLAPEMVARAIRGFC